MGPSIYSQTILINGLARLQEHGRQHGNVDEAKLDRARAQLEHDSVVALGHASQPLGRARSEQLMRKPSAMRQGSKRNGDGRANIGQTAPRRNGSRRGSSSARCGKTVAGEYEPEPKHAAATTHRLSEERCSH